MRSLLPIQSIRKFEIIVDLLLIPFAFIYTLLGLMAIVAIGVIDILHGFSHDSCREKQKAKEVWVLERDVYRVVVGDNVEGGGK